MNMLFKEKIADLRFRTEVLESLEWDEEVCNHFFEYLDSALNDINSRDPIELLEEIRDLYGVTTLKIIAQVFKKEYLDSIYIEDDTEH